LREFGAAGIAGIDIAIAIVPGGVRPHMADNVCFAVTVHQFALYTWADRIETNLKRLSRRDPMENGASVYITGLETWGSLVWIVVTTC
jgi:hypothetical protein